MRKHTDCPHLKYIMDKYDSFCSFSDSLVAGTNASVSGHACNAGFTIDGEDVDLTIVYSTSVKIEGEGLFPKPVPTKDDALAVISLLKSKIPADSPFKLKAVDCVQFKNTAVGTGVRWQWRFRR